MDVRGSVVAVTDVHARRAAQRNGWKAARLNLQGEWQEVVEATPHVPAPCTPADLALALATAYDHVHTDQGGGGVLIVAHNQCK